MSHGDPKSLKSLLSEENILSSYPKFRAAMEIASPHTRRNYLLRLRRFLYYVLRRNGLDSLPKKFTEEDVEGFYARMKARAEERGTWKLLADSIITVRAFLSKEFGEEVAERLCSSKLMRQAWEDYEKSRHTSWDESLMYSDSEERALFVTAFRMSTWENGYVYACVVGLARLIGMRPEELRRLRRSNFSPDYSSVSYWAVKHGDRVERIIPHEKLRIALERRFQWIQEVKKIPLHLDPPLFPGPGCRRSLKRRGEPVYASYFYIRRRAVEVAKAARVKYFRRPLYGFRRRLVTVLLDTLPLPDIQKAFGWRGPQTPLYYHKKSRMEIARRVAEATAAAMRLGGGKKR